MTQSLLDRLRQHITEAALFPEPGVALLAVSGGPDSVALLDLMTRIAKELGLTLAVAHVDHGIAPDSADVAEQVMGHAVRYGLGGYLAVLGLGPAASETRARRERYAALRRMQRGVAARYLVTAHHADDQVETILFRIFRGTGVAGLAGMAEGSARGLVRPLLPFGKRELADWVEALERRIVVHRDPANADPRHDRSWIRGRLLPMLRERFGEGIDARVLDVRQDAADHRAAWRAVLRALPELQLRLRADVIEVARDPLVRYDKALSQALLRALAREAGGLLGPRRAARLWEFVQRAPSGRRFEFGHHWVAEIAFGRLRFFILKETPGAPSGTTVRWGDGPAGRVHWGEWEICWRREPAGEVQRASTVTWVTNGVGEVRSRRPGDRIRPLRGVGHRRVSRVLMEGRVPRSQRAVFPLVTRGDRVIWVPGICRDAGEVPAVGEGAIRLEAHGEGD